MRIAPPSLLAPLRGTGSYGIAAVSRARRLVACVGGRSAGEATDDQVIDEAARRQRMEAAARHLELPEQVDELRAIAVSAHLDVRDLDAALVRVGLSHDLDACPGGEECLLVGGVDTTRVEG
jgi:hypothetical protein